MKRLVSSSERFNKWGRLKGIIMKYVSGCMFAVALAIAMPASAQDVTKMAPLAPGQPLTIVRAVPGDGDAKGFYLVVNGDPGQFPLADMYPSRAAAEQVGGEAVISCTVGDGGLLQDCQIVSERPAKYFFGMASQRMAQRYGRADPDVSKPGDIVRGKIGWTP